MCHCESGKGAPISASKCKTPPGQTGGAYSTLPGPLAGFKGKGRGKGRGRERDRRERRGDDRGRRGRTAGGASEGRKGRKEEGKSRPHGHF